MPCSSAGKQIRQLSIRLPAQTREMFRQQVAGLLHAVDDARREFAFAKITTHDVRQFPPEFIPAFRVNCFVADDGKLVRAGKTALSAANKIKERPRFADTNSIEINAVPLPP